jgi:hypothetical protein
MKYFIMLVVVAVLFFVFKSSIKKFILNRKTGKNEIKNVNSELVYVPVLSSRVFDFRIQIDEIGGGKATISVLKTKD